MSNNKNAVEIWKPVRGFNNYIVSSQGRVKTIRNNKIKYLSISDNGNGYKRIYLYKNGERYKFFIHRLVAEAFHKPKYRYNPVTTKCTLITTQVHHIDHDKSNNHANNLMFTTAKLNNKYKIDYYKNLGKQYCSSTHKLK